MYFLLYLCFVSNSIQLNISAFASHFIIFYTCSSAVIYAECPIIIVDQYRIIELCNYRFLYKISCNNYITSRVQVERIKSNRKVLYHFAIFVIINEILIKKTTNKRTRKRDRHYAIILDMQ